MCVQITQSSAKLRSVAPKDSEPEKKRWFIDWGIKKENSELDNLGGRAWGGKVEH